MDNEQVKYLQLNANLKGLKKGTIVKVKVDKAGTPLDQYWRRRIQDANIDNCVEFVEKPDEGGKSGVSSTSKKRSSKASKS